MLKVCYEQDELLLEDGEHWNLFGIVREALFSDFQMGQESEFVMEEIPGGMDGAGKRRR